MKKTVFILLMFCIMVDSSLARPINAPRTKKGTKALLFSLAGLDQLAAPNYNSANLPPEYMLGIGGKYFIADGSALRLSFGFGTRNAKTPGTGAPGPNFYEIKQSSTAISVSPAYLRTIAKNGSATAYIGGQLTYGTFSSTTENPNLPITKVKDSSTVFSLAALAGAEWFAWSSIAFGFEYHLAYTSSSGTHEATTGGSTTITDAPSTTSFTLASASSANLTIGFYW